MFIQYNNMWVVWTKPSQDCDKIDFRHGAVWNLAAHIWFSAASACHTPSPFHRRSARSHLWPCRNPQDVMLIDVFVRHRTHIPQTKELCSTRIIILALQFANEDMELAGLVEHRLDKLVQLFFLGTLTGMVLNHEKFDSSIVLLVQPCLFQLPLSDQAHPSLGSQ